MKVLVTDLELAASLGLDCGKGIHVARFGAACVGCGDSGPKLRPPMKFAFREPPRAETKVLR